MPVAPNISGWDTPRDEVATPVTQIFTDSAHPLNWEATGDRLRGETEGGFLVVVNSPPQGSPVRHRRKTQFPSDNVSKNKLLTSGSTSVKRKDIFKWD